MPKSIRATVDEYPTPPPAPRDPTLKDFFVLDIVWKRDSVYLNIDLNFHYKSNVMFSHVVKQNKQICIMTQLSSKISFTLSHDKLFNLSDVKEVCTVLGRYLQQWRWQL